MFRLSRFGNRTVRIEGGREVVVPLRYKALEFEQGYRLDLLVDERVVVEVKAVERWQPIHEAQLLTYLKIMDCRLGLLLNFNVDVMRRGIRRIANGV